MSASGFLKQSTTDTVKVGPFLDATDGVTEETGITPVIEVSKDNGAFAARNSATAITHDAEGYFDVELDTTDTNTVGRLIVKAHDSGTHLPVWHEFWVLEESIFDALFAASAAGFDTNQRVDVGAVLGTAQTAGDIIGSQPSNFSSLSITAGGLVDITQAAADKVWSSATRTLTAFSTSLAVSVWDVLESAIVTASSIGLKVKNNLDAAITSRLAASSAPTNWSSMGIEADGHVHGDIKEWLGSAPNALTSGRVGSQVGGMGSGVLTAAAIAADAITAAKIAADALGASELATDAVNEIRDAILSDSTPFAGANVDAAVSSRATPAQVLTNAIQALRDIGFVLTTATIETVTSQTEFIIPATDDAPDNDVYNDCIAIIIDGTDANQRSVRLVTDYVASTRSVLIDAAPEFTVTTSDTIVILASSVSKHILSDRTAFPGASITEARLAELDAANIPSDIDTLITRIPDVLSLANINIEVDNAFTTQIADSVPADGVIPTREQAIYMITQMLMEFAISGTTLTVRKVDGTTALMTFTLDDDTNPTSLTRAT